MLLPVSALSPISRRVASAGNPLHASLVAYWKFDEASGTRVDSTGRGNSLTDNNTVTSAAGKVGNAAEFVTANSEFLSRSSTADLQPGTGSFTIAGWFRAATVTGDFGILGKWGPFADREYLFDLFNGDLYWLVDNGSAIHSVIRPVAINTWYFAVGIYDAGASQISLTLNQGAAATAAHTGGAHVTSEPFEIGRYAGGRYFNGLMDEWGFWKRLLTAAEQTQLFNGGSGTTLF